MAKLILHIGMNKTGSTAIQSSLAAASGAGYVYPRLGEPPYKPHHEDGFDQTFSSERFQRSLLGTDLLRIRDIAAVSKDRIRKAAAEAGDNPVILSSSGEQKEEEGCLSVPDISEKVIRPSRVIVSAGDETLRPREIEGTGLLARALCHETDHLNRMLFVDRLRGLKRELTWKKIERRHARGVW